MKKMKHGGKARKSHKRMQDGGIASFGGIPASLGIIGGAMGRPIRGGGMTSDIGSVPMGRGGAMPSMEAQPVRLPARGRGASGLQKEIGGMGRPGRGGAMPSMEAQPVRLPGRGGAMPSAISQGIIASGAQPMGLSGSIGGATGYQAGGGMTSDADSVPMGRGFRKGGAVKAKKNMRGGGLARKGVGMALAKGGLAKRAGGCAKRGVGRGKMV